MTSAPTAPPDIAADLRQHMTQDDFPALLRRFDASSCTEEAFAVASWMFSRFPRESGALLPRVRAEQLTFDGSDAPRATTSEWAAALTAAKFLRHDTQGHAFETISEPQLDEAARHIYHQNAPRAARTAPQTGKS